jgi:hypothetical protein
MFEALAHLLNWAERNHGAVSEARAAYEKQATR